MKHSLATLALTAAAWTLDRPALPQESAPQVPRSVLVLEVDLVQARALGWTAPEADDAEGLEQAAAIVERRFAAMQRSVDLTIDAEKRRIEVALPASEPRDRELCAQLLTNIGVCELLWIADEDLVHGLTLDLASESERLDAWRRAHPSAPLEAFHSVAPDEGGPHPRLCWMQTRFDDETEPALPVLLPERPEDHIGAGGLAHSAPALDGLGRPALSIELVESRCGDLARITRSHPGSRLAIVIEGRIRSAPLVIAALERGEMSIEGRFTEQEVVRLAKELARPRGPLRVLEIR